MKAFNILLAVPLFLVAIIWSYFTRANDNVHSICTICKTKVIGGNRQSNFGTSSLISHLRTNPLPTKIFKSPTELQTSV